MGRTFGMSFQTPKGFFHRTLDLTITVHDIACCSHGGTVWCYYLPYNPLFSRRRDTNSGCALIIRTLHKMLDILQLQAGKSLCTSQGRMSC